MTQVELIAAISCIALSTFATRAGVLLLGDRLTLSRRVDSALRFAPACALSALILPDVLYPAGVLDVSLTNPRLPAALAAAVFLLWRQSIIGAIAIGMGVFALVRIFQA